MISPDRDLAKNIPWGEIAGPLVAAEDAVARLDERLARLPVRDGFIERFHFHDAAAVGCVANFWLGWSRGFVQMDFTRRLSRIAS